jgi:shikimate kinase
VGRPPAPAGGGSLDVPLETIVARVETGSRRIVGLGDATFAELYAQRHPLYMKWADYTVTGETPVETIVSYLRQ